MALCLKSLIKVAQIVVGGTDGNPTSPTIYDMRYATNDAAATVETAGYWNGARALLTVGSQITATMAAGGTPVLKTYVVTVVPATGNVVAVLQATAAG